MSNFLPVGSRGWTKYPRRVWTEHEDGSWSSREKTAADYRADLEAYHKLCEDEV